VLTRRRITLGLLAIIVVGVAFTAWQLWRVQRDLTAANDAAERLRSSIDTDDVPTRRAALGDLRTSAAAAHDHSDGAWWGLLTHLPVVGDDVTGIRALSASLDTVAAGGIQPLADAVDDLDGISTGGAVDLDTVTALQQPMSQASRAFGEARADVADLDTSGYAGFLKTRFDDYVDDITTYDRGVRSAAKATSVLPDMLGSAGPRNYLLVFQNNAEIRSTGGLPGSWALLHAEDGRLSIEQQGAGSAFARLDKPVVPLTKEEDAVYSDLLGVFFLDANFTPDFPRAAELWKARWEGDYPGTTLDGVMTLDPVALSYLLRGTGPVAYRGTTLTADNAVDQLLSQSYLTLDVAAQDVYFAGAAKAIFDAATGPIASPLEFVRGMSRAADEGRFRLASYDDPVEEALATSTVRGALADDDGTDPHVEITLNDATGSKMSYYLRYQARVTARSCTQDSQSLLGSMTLSQTITSAMAAQLPDYVNGAGVYGTAPGLQTVAVRIYSPTGGTLGDITLDGEKVTYEAQPLENRQVATLLVQLDGSDDVVVNWSMTTAAGQSGAGTVGVTPSVVAGSKDSTFRSAC